ncbi:MAG TPA: dihydroorotase [Chondromyces sp.]|nr:dihydroorotase [Chondromyces sp.]
MKRLLIRNGRVVDPSQGLDQGMDILVEDGIISAVGEKLEAPGRTQVFDAAGLVVAPGFIDLHTHLREPGFEHKETIASGCRAAAAGGFTAVCCMPDTRPVNDDPSVTAFIRERAEQAGMARVYPVGAVSQGLAGEAMAEIGEMVAAGAVAVSDDRRPVRNALLFRRALEYARSFDIPVAAHEEDLDLSDGGCMHEGRVSTRIGLAGIPTAAEEVMVARDILLAELTGGRLHLCHLSSATALDLVRTGKRRGLALSCEVAAHQFVLTDEDVAAASYDPNWKTCPPLRGAAEVEAILQAIYDGTVDAIVSDHEPHHADEKELDFSDAPAGISGLETAVPLALDRLVHGRVIGLMQLVRLMSTRPAEIFSLPGGTLREGAVADLTVLDLRALKSVEPEHFESRSRNTPFAGRRLKGWPAATIVGGSIVWQTKKRGKK